MRLGLFVSWVGVTSCLSAAAREGAPEPLLVDGVAAYVDDSWVTVGEVTDMIEPLRAEMTRRGRSEEGESQLREAYRSSLEMRVENRLILRAYVLEKNKNEEALDRRVERRVADFVHDQFKGDRSKFMAALREDHLTPEEWKDRIRERVIVQMMKARNIEARLVIPPRAVRGEYEKNPEKFRRPEEFRMRLIQIPGGKDLAEGKAQRALAGKTAQRLEEGADFAVVAREVSTDGKAAAGGDWGWIEPKSLQADLAKAASNLAIGGVSAVTEVGGDFYLLKVEGRHVAGVLPFEEARLTIEKEMRQAQSRQLYESWIRRLKKDTFVRFVEKGGVI